MSGLKLTPANESRDDGPWSPDDSDVVLTDTGERAGLVYGRTNAIGNGLEWFWGIGFPHTLKARKPCYGIAGNEAAAKLAFVERWRSR